MAVEKNQSSKDGLSNPDGHPSAASSRSTPPSHSGKVPEGWTHPAGKQPVEGWWYKPDHNAPGYRSEVLMVLVHGFRSHCLDTWADFHLQIHRELGFTCDVLNFGYPSQLVQKANLVQAGEELYTMVKPALRRYQHLLVFAHSAGGLVTKEWLLRDADMLRKAVRARQDPEGVKSAKPVREIQHALLAVRQIVNFDVPHAGGDAWKTKFWGRVYKYFLWPMFATCQKLGAPFGHNDIVQQLNCRGPYVTDLEARYVALVQELQDANFPRPVSLEFLASSGNVIAPYADGPSDFKSKGDNIWTRTDASSIRFRRNHSTVKKIASQMDVLMRHLVSELSEWKDACSASIALETFYRADEFLLEFHCKQPFGSAVGERSGPQGAVMEEVKGTVKETRQGPRQALVSGGANVGKSVLARFLIRDYCLEYLRFGGVPTEIPLLLPMQLLPVKTEGIASAFAHGSREELWEALLQGWQLYVNTLVHQERVRRDLPALPITIEWLRAQLQQSPCIMLFDAIDEFFDRHRNVIDVSHLRGCVQEMLMERDGANNSSLAIVHFVRDTLPDHETLASPQYHFIVRQPSEDEADTMYPGFKEKAQRLPAHLHKVASSPLLLPTMARHLDDIPEERTKLESSLYEECLLWLIRDSRLVENLRLNTAEEVLDILSVICWDFYVTRDFVLTIDEIQGRLVARLQTWGREPDGKGRPARARHHSFASLLWIATNDEALKSILQKTIFVKVAGASQGSTGAVHSFRVQHENWVQQLGARYLADCVAQCQPEELAFGPCTNYMFKMAGERLSGVAIDAAFLSAFLEDRMKQPYITGNFIATFVASEMEIDKNALYRLFRHPAALSGISQIVLMAGIGWRIIRNSPTDPSLHEIRKEAVSCFRDILKEASGRPGTDCSVSDSIAWCVLKEMGEPLDTPWPRLWDGQDSTVIPLAASLVCDTSTTPPTINPVHRGLQRVLIEVQETAKSDEGTPISLLHYLYLLAVAYRLDGAISAVSSCLRNSPLLRQKDTPCHTDPIAAACRRLAGME